jgi:hypothetical protein
MTTQQPTNTNTTPKDQVAKTRKLLNEMNDRAERAIDEQCSRLNPSDPEEVAAPMSAFGGKADMVYCSANVRL